VTQAIFAITDGIHAPITGSAVELSACRKGEIAETLFIAGAMVHDWEIFTPFGHAQTADVILTQDGVRPVAVQVKTATLDRGAYHVSVKRATAGRNSRPYQAHDFDVLAAYLPDRNQFVFWTFDDIRSRVSVRYDPNRHRQPGNWELLDEVAESLTNSGLKTANVPRPTVQMSTSA
jgi:hypothetical protein